MSRLGLGELELSPGDVARAERAVESCDVYEAAAFVLGPDCAGFAGLVVTAPAANNARYCGSGL